MIKNKAELPDIKVMGLCIMRNRLEAIFSKVKND